MKLQFKDIVDLTAGVGAHPSSALNKVLSAQYERGAIPLSKLTYDLSKTMKSIEGHLKDFEAARMAIIKTFDDEDKTTNESLEEGAEKANWRDEPLRIEQFQIEFGALMNTEIEVWHIAKPRTMLDQAPGLTFTPAEFDRIAWFFEPDADEQLSNVENIADHRKTEAA